eukprot:1969541-Pleurochrysis_carterae.AAC.1
MSAPVTQEDTAVALIKRVKHAFEVPQLLHDPGLPTAMLAAPLDFNVVVKNAFLYLRIWCSSTNQMRESDASAATWLRDPCPSTFRQPVPTPAIHSLALRRRT